MCPAGWGWPGRSMLWSTTASSIPAPTHSNTPPRLKICQTRMGRSLKLLHLSPKTSQKWYLLLPHYLCRLQPHPCCHSHHLPCSLHLLSLRRPLCWPFHSPCLWSIPPRPALICLGVPARMRMCTLGSVLSGRPGSPVSPTNQQSSCLNTHLSDLWCRMWRKTDELIKICFHNRFSLPCAHTECPQIGRNIQEGHQVIWFVSKGLSNLSLSRYNKRGIQCKSCTTVCPFLSSGLCYHLIKLALSTFPVC